MAKEKREKRLPYGNNSMWPPREVNCSEEHLSGRRSSLLQRAAGSAHVPALSLLAIACFCSGLSRLLVPSSDASRYPGSVRAICADALWSWFSKALKHMLKGFAELDAVLSTGSLHMSSGSLTVWLCECFRMLPPSEAGPLSFSAASEVRQAC